MDHLQILLNLSGAKAQPWIELEALHAGLKTIDHHWATSVRTLLGHDLCSPVLVCLNLECKA